MTYNKLQKIAVVVLLAIFTFGGAVKAQNLTVKGRVVDNKTGVAMPFVNVALMRPADTVFMRGATTDLDGRFNIEDVDTGSYLMQASFVGYQTVLTDLKVLKDIKDLRIELQPGTTLEEVKVVAAKPLYAMDGEKNMYNTKEDPSIQTGTASDALQNAPGVEVDAEGNITLRGVSSVEIWINDRPSHMNEEALKQYIKQMPANAIERIEVITNPSARYSTSGGVINIVTNQKITRNELLCAGVRANTNHNVAPWVSYVWANEKIDFNLYLTGQYVQHDSYSDGTQTLFDANGDTSRYQEFHTDNRMPAVGGYMGFNFNWNIDSMTTLSAWLGGYPYRDWNSYNRSYTYYEYQPTFTDMSYFDTVRNVGSSFGGWGGAWFEHRFDTTGRKLSVNFNGNIWTNGGYSDSWRDYISASLTDWRRYLTGRSYYGPSMSLGIDYTLPLKNNFELQAGAELGYSNNKMDECIDSLLADGTWSNMNMRSYLTEWRGLDPAVYVTVQKRWGGFTTKLGLRAEGTIDHGTLSHYGEAPLELDTAYFGLVPSIHLSYQTKTFSNYSFSYTRRFYSPNNVSDISLFRIYDDYSFRTGNPNLRMSYTHNLEAAFNKYIMGFGNVGLNAYFRANTDEIGYMTAADTDHVIGPYLVNYTFCDNIGSSHTEGIEANITYRPTGFINVRLNASVFNYGYNYQDFSDSKVSWSARLNVWAKLWNKLEVFANAHYSSPRLGLYSMSVANKGVDFGLSSDFFERRLSVYLNVNDIFGMTEYGENTTAPSYQTTGTNKFDSQFVSLGITWRIGKMELESKARQGASDNSPRM